MEAPSDGMRPQRLWRACVEVFSRPRAGPRRRSVTTTTRGRRAPGPLCPSAPAAAAGTRAALRRDPRRWGRAPRGWRGSRSEERRLVRRAGSGRGSLPNKAWWKTVSWLQVHPPGKWKESPPADAGQEQGDRCAPEMHRRTQHVRSTEPEPDRPERKRQDRSPTGDHRIPRNPASFLDVQGPRAVIRPAGPSPCPGSGSTVSCNAFAWDKGRRGAG